MTSSNGNIFRGTGLLCREFTSRVIMRHQPHYRLTVLSAWWLQISWHIFCDKISVTITSTKWFSHKCTATNFDPPWLTSHAACWCEAYRWLSARLQYLHREHTGVTAIFHYKTSIYLSLQPKVTMFSRSREIENGGFFLNAMFVSSHAHH